MRFTLSFLAAAATAGAFLGAGYVSVAHLRAGYNYVLTSADLYAAGLLASVVFCALFFLTVRK